MKHLCETELRDSPCSIGPTRCLPHGAWQILAASDSLSDTSYQLHSLLSGTCRISGKACRIEPTVPHAAFKCGNPDAACEIERRDTL